jgi:VCBS repeat-containing protein
MSNSLRSRRGIASSAAAVAAAILTVCAYVTADSFAQIKFDPGDLEDPPVLTLPDDITAISADPAGAVVTYKATAVDDNRNALTVNCSRPSGSLFPLNTTSVTCSATDRFGQTTTGTFTVTVLTVGPISKTRVIDFERYPGPDGVLGTADDVCSKDLDVLDTQYEALGVSGFALSDKTRPTIHRRDDFSYIQGSPASLYPANVENRTAHPGNQSFLRDFDINFSLDVFRVKISGLNADEPMKLIAYNSAGEPIATASRAAGGDLSVIPIEVRVDGSKGYIRRVRLDLRQSGESCCKAGPEFYDMLEFDPVAQLPVPSNTTRIDFENYPGPDGLLGTADDEPTPELSELFATYEDEASHKYNSLGVRFGLLEHRDEALVPAAPTIRESEFVYVPGSPRSFDPRSKFDRERGCGERCLKDFEMVFPDPVSRVKLAALNADETVRLRAYNMAGELVASASRGAGGDRAVHFIEVRVDPRPCQTADKMIHRVVLDLEFNDDNIGPELYDLLEFDRFESNRAPAASDVNVSAYEDTDAAVELQATDPDAGNVLTYAVLSQPSHGKLSGTGASLTYTPDPDYNGPDSFTYSASDGRAASNVATVRINVAAVNDTPSAAPDGEYRTREDERLSVAAADGVLSNDTDVDVGGNEGLIAVFVSGPSNGTLTLNADGSFVYTPGADFRGDDSFTYSASDGEASSPPVRVSIRVEEVNDPPTARDDPDAETPEDTAVTINVLVNDSDPDDKLFLAAVTQGADGSVNVNPDQTLTYTPRRDFFGTDTFTYTLDDRRGGTSKATVTVNVRPVNDAPVAQGQRTNTNEDTKLPITLSASDVDDQLASLTFTVVTPPSHGALSGAGPNLVYEPALNYYGPDSFSFRASDGKADSAPAIVSIDVFPVNDPPVATPNRYGTDEDMRLSVSTRDGVLRDDTDVDEGDAGKLTAVLVSGPSHGALAFNADGSFVYTPEANFNGEDTFTYLARDLSVGSEAVTVTITVNAVNDAPVAKAENYTTAEDNPLTVMVSDGVLKNDEDVEGKSSLKARLRDEPTHGTLALNADGSFAYAPYKDYYGSDSFTYVASDGAAASDPATVTISVSRVNDPPAAAPDVRGTDEDTPLTFAADGLRSNDSAGPANEGDQKLTVTAVADAGNAHGTVSLLGGEITYSPAPHFNGVASFEYTVCDDGKTGDEDDPECSKGSVTVNVAAVNDPPPASDYTFDVREDTPTSFEVVKVEEDVDGDRVTLESVTQGVHGSVVIDGEKRVIYTPGLNYNGPDSFTYTVKDGKGATATARVVVNVTPVNDPPVFVPMGPITVNAGDTLTFTLSVTDPDAGDLLTYSSPNLPGDASLTPTGSFSWTPCYQFSSVEITFVVKDLAGASDTTTVTVTVVGVVKQLERLRAELAGLPLTPDEYHTLDNDLKNALNAFEDYLATRQQNKLDTACRKLGDFKEGAATKHVALTEEMTQALDRLRRMLGCLGGGAGSCQ